MATPSLFGITNSNRDFTSKETWGKNQFNSSFPASLCCYLDSVNLDAAYLALDSEGDFQVLKNSISNIFGMSPKDKDIYFAFESSFPSYQKYLIGHNPRTDLVIQNSKTGICSRALEVKLTALPDHVTCELKDEKYGSEIVVRPDTIVYLACSILDAITIDPDMLKVESIKVNDWSDPKSVLTYMPLIFSIIRKISKEMVLSQIPFLVQPIWKTNGKSPKLAKNCLDVFVWSNAGFCTFISEIGTSDKEAPRINRLTRTVVWLYRMLLDYVLNGKFNHEKIIDELSFNTKNDKAFAANGSITNRFMKSDYLTCPRVTQGEIKKIILGGGHTY